jgi:hypothetical protein
MELVPLSEVREALMSGKIPTPVDAGVVADMIAKRLLETESLDELMDIEGQNSTAKILNQPMMLRGAIFMPSDIEDATIPVFAVMDMVDTDGVPHVMTCGAQGVLIQLLRLMEANALPRAVKLIEVGRQKGLKSRPIYLQDIDAAGLPGRAKAK